MSKQEPTVNGQVTEVLPNMLYRIELEGGQEVIGYASGKIRIHKIRILIGDRVSVVLDPYGGKSTNRIVRRL